MRICDYLGTDSCCRALLKEVGDQSTSPLGSVLISQCYSAGGFDAN